MSKRSNKKVKAETIKSSAEGSTIVLNMKGLRMEVLAKLEELFKESDLMQIEIKFDRQEGMALKALIDSTPAEYISGRFYFNEDGGCESSFSRETSDDFSDGFPQKLYDAYDSQNENFDF